MLRMDRLAEVTTAAADALEALPRAEVEAALPPVIRSALGPLRLVRIDLVGLVTTTATDSLRRLPDLAAADPERAEDVARWIVHAAAYLTDQVEDPPPGWLRSPPATG